MHILKLDLVDIESIKVGSFIFTVNTKIHNFADYSAKTAAKSISEATNGVIDFLIHSGAILMHPSARLSLDTL